MLRPTGCGLGYPTTPVTKNSLHDFRVCRLFNTGAYRVDRHTALAHG